MRSAWYFVQPYTFPCSVAFYFPCSVISVSKYRITLSFFGFAFVVHIKCLISSCFKSFLLLSDPVRQTWICRWKRDRDLLKWMIEETHFFVHWLLNSFCYFSKQEKLIMLLWMVIVQSKSFYFDKFVALFMVLSKKSRQTTINIWQNYVVQVYCRILTDFAHSKQQFPWTWL